MPIFPLFWGILPRFWPHFSVETYVSLPLLRQQRGTRLAHNVRHCFPPKASRCTPHTCRAGVCHRPPNCQKSMGPDRVERPHYLSMTPNRAMRSCKSNISSPLPAAQPLTFLSCGWEHSTPVAPGVPAGWPSAATPVVPLL